LHVEIGAAHGHLHGVFAILLGDLLHALDKQARDVHAPRLEPTTEDDVTLTLDVVERLEPDAALDAGRLLALRGHLRDAARVERPLDELRWAHPHVLV